MERNLDLYRYVIVTNNSFEAHSGGGVILRTLFSNFDSKEILNFHYDSPSTTQTNDFPATYHLKPKVWPVLWGELSSKVIRYLYLSFKNLEPLSLSDFVRIYISSVLPPNELLRSLKDDRINPDIIYCWPGDRSTILFVQALRKVTRAKVIVHFMDNHFDLRPKRPIDQVLQPQLANEIKGLVQSASAVFAISEGMSVRFSGLLKTPCKVFNAPINIHNFAHLPHKPKNSSFKICYVGTLEDKQSQSFAILVSAIQILRRRGQSVSITAFLSSADIYSIKRLLQNFDGVSLNPHPTFARLPHTLSNFDAALVVYDFSKKAKDHYKFSYPTKFPMYMASKRPIFALGPDNIEPILSLKRNNCGYVCNTNEVAKVVDHLACFIANHGYRKKLVKKALEICKIDHDLLKQSARFRAAFHNVAGSDQQ